MTVAELQAALKQLSEVNVYHPEHLRQLLARLKELANATVESGEKEDGA